MKVIRFSKAESYEPEENWQRFILCNEKDVSPEQFVKPPYHAAPLHEHPNPQVLTVLKGKLGILTDENEQQRLEEGDAASKTLDVDKVKIKNETLESLKKLPAYDSGRIVAEAWGDLLRKKGLPEEEINKSLADLDDSLKWAGKRVYFGWHPSTVAIWGRKGNEMELFAKKMLADVADDKGFRSSIDDASRTIEKLGPPGFKVPEFPYDEIKSFEEFDALANRMMKWFTDDVVSAAGEQVQKNLADGKPLSEALGSFLGSEDVTESMTNLMQRAAKEGMSAEETNRELMSILGSAFSDNKRFSKALSGAQSSVTKRGLIFVWLVQHAAFPGGGAKAQGAFEKAARDAF